MKKFNVIMSGLLMQAGCLFSQSYLAPAEGYRVAEFLADYARIGAFDIKGNRVFIQDGDTIHVLHSLSGEKLGTYGEPEDYEVANYASFLTVSPDETSLWAGYTSDGNADDRIYCIDMESGEWRLAARFPGNYDLIFWKDHLLVSGLNSATWGDPNGIYVLDTSGLDQHRLVVETRGNSAGMALDTLNNLYYGTSYSMDPNAIYKWSGADLEAVISSPGSDTLKLSDALKLTDVPAGVTDCEMDAGFNLVFSMNQFGSSKVVAMYNGTFLGGDGFLLDTLAVADGEWDWLGSVKSMGDFTQPVIGDRLVTFSFGKSLVDLHTADYPPMVSNPLEDILLISDGRDTVMDLGRVFSDPDDPDDSIRIRIFSNSNEDLLEASVENDKLTLRGKIQLLKTAYEEIRLVLEGNSGGLTVQDSLTVSLDWPGGIKDHTGMNISLYPNPNRGSFVIQTGTPEPVHVSVFSLTGAVVQQNAAYTSGQEVDIQELPSGPYLLRIRNSLGTYTTVIQKL